MMVPLIYRFLDNKCKRYVITNQRLYVERGIIAKSKRDIPLEKINDAEMSQGIVQRMFGSGNILVMTGNDKPNTLGNIDQPDDFKDQLTAAIKK